MAEPFAKPTKEQLRKALEIYSDPLLFGAINTTIRTLNKLNPEKIDFKESQFKEWEFLSRRVLWKFGLVQIVGHIYRLAEEGAEQYWKDWKPPEIKKDKKLKMIPGEWKSG